MAYPCQKAAASQALLITAMVPFLIRDGIHFLKNRLDLKTIPKLALVVASIGAITLLSSEAYDYALRVYNDTALEKISSRLSARLSARAEFADAAPAAISSPHRVVMVHDDEASSWLGQRTDYWNMIDQASIDAMVDRGLRALTGAATPAQAWNRLIPNYQPHQKIAIKVNNNNTGALGSDWGSPRDEDIDAIIEPVNSVVKSLLQAFGSDISTEDIWVYESHRCFFYGSFMERAESGVQFYSAVASQPPNVNLTGFSGTGPNSIITFRYNPSISLALNDVVVNADYLINMPIVKKHGYGSATLGFKNHYGSIQPDDGRYFSATFHSYGRFLRTNNNLVDISNNPHIRDKTVLIVGDAIIGSHVGNYGPPGTWTSRFPAERTPEMLFFAVDPIAADSVMADLLLWENGSEDVGNTRNYMLEAMDIGLGIAEIGTWAGSSYPNVDITYRYIDLIRIDLPDEPPQTFYVPDDYSTIQQALDAGMDGDTIIVRDGTYAGAGNKNLDFHGRAITLRSENGPDDCIIDCEGDGAGFVFYSGESSFSIVRGFTIINGNSSYGGGIYCLSSSPTITGCVISSNSSSYGGGVCLSSSSATITNCTITGNTADQGAGGIYCYDSTAIISHCTISDNSALSGGGIFCYAGSPIMINCIMTFDSASYGPEILLSGGASLSVGYSNIEGGQLMAYVEPGCTLNWGAGNVNVDPLFVGGGDYHLSEISPCIDAGVNAGIYTDIDGNLRPQNLGFDMGSDEYSGSCVYSITPESALFSAGGGIGSVNVAAQGGCDWTATSNDGWITITSGDSGSGNGDVVYWISSNPGTTPRSGSMTIAEHTFTVNQTGEPCMYSITPDSASFAASGGTGSVNVTAQAGCVWTTTSNDSWITITSGGSGIGDGTVIYSVSENQEIYPRSGSMTIAGHAFTVNQTGESCAYSIAPESASFAASGGTGSVKVTAQAGCDWSATSNDSWITITSGSNGSGDGTVRYLVSSNQETTPRSGSMTIAGKTFAVDQAGMQCEFSISPSTAFVEPSGGTIHVDVTAPANCAWTAAGNDSWITIISGDSGSGNGTVTLSVSPNSGESHRVGSATIAGEIFNVNQFGVSGMLTQIDLVYPPDGSTIYMPPAFTWTVDGGANVVYAVDFSLSYPIAAYWSTFENMGLQIRDTSWTMPAAIWDRVPAGSYVYWRVRGADRVFPSPTIIESGEVRWLYKY